MKKALILTCALCVLAGAGWAGITALNSFENRFNQTTDYSFTKSYRVTGSQSMTITNDLLYPWRIGGVSIQFPASGTWTVDMFCSRDYSSNAVPRRWVSTNEIGRVVTNVVVVVTNHVYHKSMQTLAEGVTFTTVSNAFLCPDWDFPGNYWLLAKDRLTIRWNATTNVWVDVNGRR